MATEGEQILARLSTTEQAVLLDERGKELTSRILAARLTDWQADSRDLCFIIGGPDGVSDAIRRRADFTWSLSQLTLPHGMARVLLAEQLYRAWSLQTGHPYHRA
jgi:23S rRNA (pseudouridine1915-N3)-methyltransferase